MRIAIIDDNKLEAEMLMDFCRSYAAENQMILDLQFFESSIQFLESFERNLYEIIFLNLAMEQMQGIETAKKIRQEDSSGLLVALMTSTEHMPEAFSFHAFEYVLKPVSQERIFQVLTDAAQALPASEHYINFASKRQSIKLPASELMYAVSAGHYVDITCKDGTIYHSRMNFNSFLSLLQMEEERFLEINRGIVVNLAYVENVDENRCLMANGISFPVKVRERTVIRQQWQSYRQEQRK